MPQRGLNFLALSLITAVSAFSVASAQDVTSVHPLLERYRTPTLGISISVISTEVKNGKTIESETQIFFKSSATFDKVWLVLSNYKDSKWTSSLLGDGEQMWAMDATKRQYSTQTYGTGTKALSKMLALIKSQNSLQAWAGIRLLEDLILPVYPWKTWQPMMEGPTYDKSAIIYRQGSNVEHRFNVGKDLDKFYLTNVILGDYAKTWTTERVITPKVGLPDGLSFEFKAPSGWTQVVGLSSQKYEPK